MRLIVLIMMTLGLLACQEHHEPLAHKLKKHNKKIENPIPQEMSDNLYQGSTETSKFQGKALKPFEVQTRQNKISHYPCQQCHEGQVPKGAIPKSHWQQKLNHAPGMQCATCHDDKNHMKLMKFEGEEVSFNHSYQLCQKCHFQQVNDWAGGAHGKRLGGWAGTRKVTNCATCHNPHDPAFKSKLPAIEMPEM